MSLSKPTTVYVLYETQNYRKENFVNMIGTFLKKEDAIAKMNKQAEHLLACETNCILKNPNESYYFEYISIENNKKKTSNNSIYVILPKDKYPYIEGNIFIDNPWVIDDNFSNYEITDGYKLINKLFNTNFTNEIFEYSEENFGIKGKKNDGFQIYFRSMVADKEYVKDILRKIYSIIQPDNSYLNPSKKINIDDYNNSKGDDYENTMLYAWLSSIENEDFCDAISFEEYGYGNNRSKWSTIYVIEECKLE